MIHLLDVNVLIAMVDSASPFHAAAMECFQRVSGEGWATCPMTENGFVRIVGHPAFPCGPGSAEAAREPVQQWRAAPGHQFWEDDLSLCDARRFPELPGWKQLTDCYLLALAVQRGGKLVTFDRGIDPGWVAGGAQALLVLESPAG